MLRGLGTRVYSSILRGRPGCDRRQGVIQCIMNVEEHIAATCHFPSVAGAVSGSEQPTR